MHLRLQLNNTELVLPPKRPINLPYGNTKKQGDVGLGAAIGWFTCNGYIVSIPLTDSQDYDLIVEKDDCLLRVQVKMTVYKCRNIRYEANLSIKGGNHTKRGTIKPFDVTKVDYIFVTTGDFTQYLIPTAELTNRFHLILGIKYDKFIV